MNEIKVNLTMLLQGRTMLSEQECLRKVRKPLMGKGKKANKQVIDKNGKEVWITVKEPDPAKTNRFVIELTDKDGNVTTITIYTRGSRPATKTINISEEAYRYFISGEAPEKFCAPKDFKLTMPPYKKSPAQQAWLAMSENERLLWHLNDLCSSMGGTLAFYTVHGD